MNLWKRNTAHCSLANPKSPLTQNTERPVDFSVKAPPAPLLLRILQSYISVYCRLQTGEKVTDFHARSQCIKETNISKHFKKFQGNGNTARWVDVGATALAIQPLFFHSMHGPMSFRKTVQMSDLQFFFFCIHSVWSFNYLFHEFLEVPVLGDHSQGNGAEREKKSPRIQASPQLWVGGPHGRAGRPALPRTA